MFDKGMQLDALDALAAGGAPPADDTVICRVCDAAIDKESGEPAEPITERNAAAVQNYITTAGQAEEGGVQLV